jgi:hypothetical protein
MNYEYQAENHLEHPYDTHTGVINANHIEIRAFDQEVPASIPIYSIQYYSKAKTLCIAKHSRHQNHVQI